MADKSISFRSQLKGSIDDFLAEEGLHCAETYAAITMAVADLAAYSEEGVTLSPDVYFCDDVASLAAQIHGAEVIPIGQGPRAPETVRKALKECAPLAKNPWSIFIERRNEEFFYGVFNFSNLPLSVLPSEVLFTDGYKSFAISIKRLGVNTVELTGKLGKRLVVFFSAAKPDAARPTEAIAQVARKISSAVTSELRDQVERYVFRVLTDSLPECHGSLIAILPDNQIPDALKDAVKITPPLSISNRVGDFIKFGNNEELVRLQATASLIKGMLQCDGIVVFGIDGTLLAYRCFISSVIKSPGAVTGGARRKAFEGLKQLVLARSVCAAFIQSQDGATEYAEMKNE